MAKRRDLLKLAGFDALSALAAGPAGIPSVTIGPGKAKRARKPFGDLRIYFEGATDKVRGMTAGSLLLKPGMTPHAPHTHPEEEFMVITEGTGEISLEGKITRVAP